MCGIGERDRNNFEYLNPARRFGDATESSRNYFEMAEDCLTVLMNVVVARVCVRSRR